MFGLIRKSTHEKQVSALEDELENRVEAEKQKNHKTERSKGNVLDGLDTLMGRLDTFGTTYDEVRTLDSDHIGYKATQDAIVTLLIPEGATVVFPTNAEQRRVVGSSPKYRTNEAIVIAVQEVTETGRPIGLFQSRDYSLHYGDIEYRVGSTVTPDRLDCDTSVACTNGIHFFASEYQAKDWYRR